MALVTVSTYARAQTINRTEQGRFLSTADQFQLEWIDRAGTVSKINRTKMPYRMRLAAIAASDKRKGKVWQ